MNHIPAPMIGGVVTSVIMVRMELPAIYSSWGKTGLSGGKGFSGQAVRELRW
jgi:Cu/Ag efflux pump CusA